MSQAGSQAPALVPAPAALSPGHALRHKIKDALLALSLAHLSLISAWYGPLNAGNFGYFNQVRVELPTLLALLVNLGGFALLLYEVIRWRRRCTNRWLRLILDLLFLALLLLPADFCRTRIFHIPDYQVVRFFRRPVIAVLAAAALGLILWQHRRVARSMAVVVGLFSPFAFFTTSKIALVALGIVHLAQAPGEPKLPAPGPVRPGQPRVIWLLFDETDQRLGFEQRPPGLKLPEFDRLRAASLYATNAVSPGDSTALSIPGLLTGRRASQVRIQNASDLILTMAESGATTN